MKFRSFSASLIGLIGSLIATQALAHHASDGQAPMNFLQGLVSGLAHPVIGVDHLAFLLVMGVAAAFTKNPRLAPLVFVASSIIGCLLIVAGAQLPWLEIGVTATVVFGGVMILSGRQYSPTVYVVFFAIAGILHGGAYGAAILGTQMEPLLAYLAGFASIQYAIAVTVAMIAGKVSKFQSPASLYPRLAGGILTGIGLVFLIQSIEAVLVA